MSIRFAVKWSFHHIVFVTLVAGYHLLTCSFSCCLLRSLSAHCLIMSALSLCLVASKFGIKHLVALLLTTQLVVMTSTSCFSLVTSSSSHWWLHSALYVTEWPGTPKCSYILHSFKFFFFFFSSNQNLVTLCANCRMSSSIADRSKYLIFISCLIHKLQGWIALTASLTDQWVVPYFHLQVLFCSFHSLLKIRWSVVEKRMSFIEAKCCLATVLRSISHNQLALNVSILQVDRRTRMRLAGRLLQARSCQMPLKTEPTRFFRFSETEGVMWRWMPLGVWEAGEFISELTSKSDQRARTHYFFREGDIGWDCLN